MIRPKPPAQTHFGITKLTPTSFTVNWQRTTGNPAPVYRVQYRNTGTQTWINNPLGTTPNVSQLVAGLTPATQYDVRVEAINIVGVNYSNVVQATTPASGQVAARQIFSIEWSSPTISESPNGSVVPTTIASLTASATPGSAGTSNNIALTVGNQITVNGGTAFGSSIQQLYYLGHTAFAYNGTTWSGPVTASGVGTTVSNPKPTVAISNTSIAAGSAIGTLVGNLSVAVGAGTFAWNYTVSSSNFTVAGSALNTATVLATGSYPATITATPTTAIIGSPFTLPITVTVSGVAESPDGSAVPATTATIIASATPGSPGSSNSIALTSGQQITVNGGTPFGAAVTVLYYIGHTCFQFGTGAWYQPVTAAGGGVLPAVADPHPTLSLSGTNVPVGSTPGYVIGAMTTVVGAGTFSWAYSVSDTAHFAFSGANLVTAAVLTTGTSYPLTITATPTPSILGGPFTLVTTIQASGVAPTESPAGTAVPATSTGINASPTPGTPGSGNIVLIDPTGAISVNGTIVGGSAVTALYYIGNTCFQFGNGAWYKPVTATSPGVLPSVPDPHPVVTLSNSTILANPAIGTTVGNVGVTVGAGSYTFTYTLNTTNFVVTAGVLKTNATLANGNYSFMITATNSSIIGSPFTLPVNVSVGVSGLTFPFLGFSNTNGNEGTFLGPSFGNGVSGGANLHGGEISSPCYNEHGAGTWAAWPTFFLLGGPPPYYNLQVSPGPDAAVGLVAFNAVQYIQHLISNQDGVILGNNIKNVGGASVVYQLNYGWEWNGGGENDYYEHTGAGWDQPGLSPAYWIEFFRTGVLQVKSIVPNILICYACNHCDFNSGLRPMDYYPGDDVVDIIACDAYQEYAPGDKQVSDTDQTKDTGYCFTASSATYLGPSHPAKATGQMTLPVSGATVTIPFGNRKYYSFPEWQAWGQSPVNTYVQDVFAQAARSAGRCITLDYWNTLSSADAANSIVINGAHDLNNNSYNAWLAATTNKLANILPPIPKLSN